MSINRESQQINLFNQLEEFNSNTCFIDQNEKKISYKSIINNSKKITHELEPRSLVFNLTNNHIESLTSYMGFFRKGLVQILLDPKINYILLQKLINTYSPDYIYLPIVRNEKFKNYSIMNKFNVYKILKIGKTKKYSVYKNLALLLTTSGSTGSKKFVRISYENIHNNTKNIIKYLKINQSHKTITTMPPFYTYGLSILNTHLFVGASIVVTEASIVEKLFWDLLKNQKITSFGGVPYFYEILKKVKFNKMVLPNLKYFTQAGGALNKDLIKYFIDCAELNKSKFIIMYGQTEATARMTYLPYNAIKKKIGSIGIPIPGGEIELKNIKISKNNKKGEIIYKGKNVSMGYANSYSDLKKKNENNQILSTGDLAEKDKDGYLFIIGRKSREIKLHGHRINLNELEAMLASKGYRCICHYFDNIVTIFHTNKSYDKKILKNLSLISKININSLRLKLLKEFPYNNNGKIAYNKLEGMKK